MIFADIEICTLSKSNEKKNYDASPVLTYDITELIKFLLR